jgi:uncharacterized protein
MEFNTAQLLLASTGETRQYELDDDITGLDPELHPLGCLTGMVRFTKTDRKILVTGKLRVTLELECQRCLEPFAQEVGISLVEEFQPKNDVRTGAPLDGEDVDSAVVIDERNILDLSEVVRQGLLLASSEFVVCRDDCKGLCAQCGHNLNESECDCLKHATDPRWMALDSLRGQHTEK